MMNQPKNMLVVVCDQLAAQALPAWGNGFARTPNLQGLAERGVRFSEAYSTCPLCQPSRASFWTGLYPHQTGVTSNGRLMEVAPVSDSVQTLGSVFREGGYRTIHFGKEHDQNGLRGFERVPVEKVRVEAEHAAWPVGNDTFMDRGNSLKAAEFLRGYEGDAPFLAVADFTNPHDICSWIEAFKDDAPRVPPPGERPPLPGNLYREEGVFETLPLPVQYLCCAHNRQAQIAAWGEEKIRDYLAAYYHYVERVDGEVGWVLEALAGREDAEETMVVMLADHGDSMCGRWMATKHTTFYDETVRVPLIFAGAGVWGEDRAVEGPVSLLDVLPTLCDAAGLGWEAGKPGRSLLPWVRGEGEGCAHEAVVSEWHTEWGYTVEPGRMVRTEGFKYMHYLEGNGEELYDLRSDPGEVRNLAGDPAWAETLKRHRELLSEHARETGDPYFSLEWKADARWRSHPPGYRKHRGVAAPKGGGD